MGFTVETLHTLQGTSRTRPLLLSRWHYTSGKHRSTFRRRAQGTKVREERWRCGVQKSDSPGRLSGSGGEDRSSIYSCQDRPSVPFWSFEDGGDRHAGHADRPKSAVESARQDRVLRNQVFRLIFIMSLIQDLILSTASLFLLLFNELTIYNWIWVWMKSKRGRSAVDGIWLLFELTGCVHTCLEVGIDWGRTRVFLMLR